MIKSIPFYLLFFFFFAGLFALESEAARDTGEKEEEQQALVDDPVSHELVVTATRTPTKLFNVPQSIQLVDLKKISQKLPDNPVALFHDLPGLDVVGIGGNQARPVIRGFRGQRILLLDNGIRMNNSARQQDFGEITSPVEASSLDRIEILQGPSSVLYGSDAIGGVINMITDVLPLQRGQRHIGGQLRYRYGSAMASHKGGLNLRGALDRFYFIFQGDIRGNSDYKSASGRFGGITLDEPVTVTGSGVEDRGLSFSLGWQPQSGRRLELSHRYYQAQNAGFGFVEPQLYGYSGPRIEINYPRQIMSRWRLDYEHTQKGFLPADYFKATVYMTDNDRDMSMSVNVPINIPRVSNAAILMERETQSLITTRGGRLELRKLLGDRHALTYGLDFFMDQAQSQSRSSSQTIGFGSPNPVISLKPEMPHAELSSFGVFLQDEFHPWPQGTLILGARYQHVLAKTLDTPFLEELQPASAKAGTMVGALNYLHQLTPHLNVYTSLARGFRSPNLIEQFFSGITPDGGAYQSRNAALESETSLNYELGLRFRKNRIDFTASLFQNTLFDGIRTVPTGRFMERLPEYHNVNIDRIRVSGYEFSTRWQAIDGLWLSGDFSKLKGRNVSNPEIPYTEHFNSKLNFSCRYENPGGRFWMAWETRYQGKQQDVVLANNPLGPVIPSFMLHSLGLGINIMPRSDQQVRLVVWIRNLSDTLYCETANASFFRPAPGREILASLLFNF